MQANQTEMQAVEAATITKKIEATPTVTVPLSSLVKSKFNVRKKEPTGIPGLAENIAENGQMQNLIVHLQPGRKKEQYGVAGGQRRHAAFNLLLSQGRVEADHPIDVKIVSQADALMMSLSENTAREAMHPSDQIDAFMALVDEGKSAEYIATIFGITALTVERRLKLANTSPKLRELLREDRISPEQLAALALADDHETQERVWENARNDWQREPARLRAAIAGKRISVLDDPLATFVGLAAFEAAGGHVVRDLFSNDGEAYIEDGELLQQLVAQKFEGISEQVRAEGWAWVEALPQVDYAYRSRFATVEPIVRPLTDEEKAEISSLTPRLEELQNLMRANDEYDEDDEDESGDAGVTQESQPVELTHDQYAAMQNEAAVINARIAEIREGARTYSDELKATAGVLVYLNHQGDLKIDRGFVRRGDQKQAVAAAGSQVRNLQPEKAKAVHSEKLMMVLSTHHTAAVQAELVAAPNVALAVLAHRLSERAVFGIGSQDDPAKLQMTDFESRIGDVDGIAGSDAYKAMEASRKKWKKEMPKQSAARFQWLLTQPQETVIELLAFCTACCIDGTHVAEDHAPLAYIAKAVSLDMSEYWSATSASYFSHVSKGRIVEVVSEAVSADEGKKLETMKKAEAADAAEKALREAGSKWLPATLRTKADKPKKEGKKAAAPAVAAVIDAPQEHGEVASEPVAAWQWPTAATMNPDAQRLAA